MEKMANGIYKSKEQALAGSCTDASWTMIAEALWSYLHKELSRVVGLSF
jgi:hypothetical protein